MERYEACLKGWELKKLLGEGTYGKVFQGCKGECRYAVKIVELEDDKDVAAFRKEAKITDALSDANLSPKLYDYWVCETADDKKFGLMVVDKFDMDLHGYLKKFYLNKSHYQEIVELVRNMHFMNYAHLDLKPENILVKMDGDVPTFRLIDFGFSVDVDERPLSAIKTEEFVEYYKDLYGSCFTESDKYRVYAIKNKHLDNAEVRKIKKEARGHIDPRFIDEAFLCKLKKKITDTSTSKSSPKSKKTSSKKSKKSPKRSLKRSVYNLRSRK